MTVRKNTALTLLLFLLYFIIPTACNDKNSNPGSEIPNVYVNFYLQPNTIDFMQTQGWKYYNEEGYRGVIVYRLDQDNFYAYERTCPYDAQKDCARVEVTNSGVLMVDSCCMSYYSILDGMPVAGPTTSPLKQYFTEFDGNMLHVYNNP
jgi:nitrite reductase/ring-hydroxylating ferredoxin subunit